jgi:hypothetical protein
VGALILAFTVLAEVNQWPALERQYVTSIPLSTWRLYVVVSVVVVPLLAALLCWLLAGLAASLYPAAWNLWRGASRRVWRRDAAVCIALVLAAGVGLNKLGALFAGHFHAIAPANVEVFPDMFNAALPGAAFFLRALEMSIVGICGLGLTIYVIRLGWVKRAWWLWAGILLSLIGLGPASAHSMREFWAGWVMSFVPLAVAVAIVVLFFRDNLLAYFGAVFCVEVAQPLASLFSQHATYYRANGLLLAVLAFLFLAWLLFPSANAEGRSES